MSETPQPKPKLWHLKQRRIWNEQMRIIAVAQNILQTPDLSFKSQIEVIGKAKEMYDEVTL